MPNTPSPHAPAQADAPYPTLSSVNPTCPSCGGNNTLIYMGALREGELVHCVACMTCNHRFSVPAAAGGRP